MMFFVAIKLYSLLYKHKVIYSKVFMEDKLNNFNKIYKRIMQVLLQQINTFLKKKHLLYVQIENNSLIKYCSEKNFFY